jgi:LPXTG-motif cell wall-anchored protein
LEASAALVDEEALAAEDRRSWASSAFWGWVGLVAVAALVTLVVLLVRRRRRHPVDV